MSTQFEPRNLTQSGSETTAQDKSTVVVKSQKAWRDKNRSSFATVWQSAKKVSLEDVGTPVVIEPGDAIVRITTTAICGSDLHMFTNEVPGVGAMKKGDVLGHEAVGFVEDVGRDVKKFKRGDRVAISAVIACGECFYCKQLRTSMCNKTNPSEQMRSLYGHNLAGVFGYTHLTGGYDGLQAEHARVPLADFNLLKLSDKISDDEAVCLSDVCNTAWHGNELAEVDNKTESLVVFGAGPIGLLSAYFAKHRGAKKVFVVDHHEYRLERARFIGAETLNYEEVDVVKELQQRYPNGVEKCIDCVGYRSSKSLGHRVARALKIESDSPVVIEEIIKITMKGGNIALIGDYFGNANQFPVGALMEKGFTLRGGQLFVQKYWELLRDKIEAKEIDPTFILSHKLPLTDVAKGYDIFNNRLDNSIKVILRTRFYNLNESGGEQQRLPANEQSESPPADNPPDKRPSPFI